MKTDKQKVTKKTSKKTSKKKLKQDPLIVKGERLFMACAHCGNQSFVNSYGNEERVLYADCSRCGTKTAKFYAEQFYDEPSSQKSESFEVQEKNCNDCRHCAEKLSCKTWLNGAVTILECPLCHSTKLELVFNNEDGVLVFACPSCNQILGDFLVEMRPIVETLEETGTEGNC